MIGFVGLSCWLVVVVGLVVVNAVVVVRFLVVNFVCCSICCCLMVVFVMCVFLVSWFSKVFVVQFWSNMLTMLVRSSGANVVGWLVWLSVVIVMLFFAQIVVLLLVWCWVYWNEVLLLSGRGVVCMVVSVVSIDVASIGFVSVVVVCMRDSIDLNFDVMFWCF